MRNLFVRVLVVFWIVVGFSNLMANESALNNHISFNNSKLTKGLCLEVELMVGWKDGNSNIFQVPFHFESKPTLDLFFELDVNQLILDSNDLFLYLEGIEGVVDIYFNERIIEVDYPSFSEFKIKIERDWWKGSENFVKLKIRRTEDTQFFQSGIGLQGKIAILSSCDEQRKSYHPVFIKSSPRTLVYPSFDIKEGRKVDLDQLWKDLKQLKKENIKSLWFPVHPTGEVLLLIRKAGMILQKEPNFDGKLALFRNTKTSDKFKALGPKVWIDKKGKQTEFFGRFRLSSQTHKTKTRGNLSFPYVFVMISPLFFLVLIKLVHPVTFSEIGEFVRKRKFYTDQIKNNRFLTSTGRLLLSTLRVFLLASILSLFTLYVWENHPGMIENNIFANFFNKAIFFLSRKNPIILYRNTVVLFLFFQAIKTGFYFMAGILFGQSGLSGIINSGEIYRSLPYLFVLYATAIFFTVSGPFIGKILFGLFLVLWALNYARFVFEEYLQLEINIGLKPLLKILYICAFEILPLAILF